MEASATVIVDMLRAVLGQLAEPAQLLRAILGQAVAATGADRGLFVEVTGSGDLAYRVLFRFSKDQLAGEAGRFSRGVLSETLRKGGIVRISNAASDQRFISRESVHDLRLTSVLCAPILVEGKVAALVHLESNRPDYFQGPHEAMLASLAELAGPALGALRASESVLAERAALRQSREELEQSRQFLAEEWSFGRFVGRSAPVRVLAETARKVSQTDFPVLLLGETGTGKTILARTLHHTSPRGRAAFVTVFCPSLQREMVETELFGHRRGAFTGAVADRPGKIQAAEGGTLFLDEVGELPLEIQPKLLRLLQEKTYERVGDATERRSDARLIAATNRDLEHEVAQGRFRRDLYERLNFVPIHVPPLRERREDIPLLLRHCLDQHEVGRWLELTEDAARFLVELDFAWPGNVRHIEQLAARLAVEGGREPLTADRLATVLGPIIGRSRPAVTSSDGAGANLEQGLPALLESAERGWIQEAMQRYPQISRAELAAKLQIGESTLYKKMRLYGIEG